MRLILAACASCLLLASLGCGLELTKEEGTRRQAGGSGIGGVGITDLSSPPSSPAPSTTQPSTPPVESAPAQAEQPPAQPAETPAPTQPAQAAASPPANTTAAEDAVTVGTRSNDPNSTVVVARRGVGAQGRFDTPGYTFVVLRSYFLTKQRLELEVKVPEALKLYQAEHGYLPKTVEDFNRDIIEANGIKLPELPKGHRYVYDPKEGLGVEKPN